MGGAFLTSRELFDNPIWKNVVDFRLFFLIYGQAIFEKEGYQQSETLFLNRGEWCRSIRNLQSDLEYIENRQIKRYSLSVLSRCIKRLEQSQRICTRSHELGTVFTVVNYEQYQALSSYRKENLERNLEHLGNSGGTVEEQSGNNNNNGIKEKKAKKVKKVITYSDDFLTFWDSYPKQIGQPAAYTNWNKLIKTIEPSYLIACGMNYASYVIANETEYRYIKQPNNFLNAKEEYYKQYETPVLIHSRKREPEKQMDKLQQMYAMAEEEERHAENRGYQAY